MTEQREQIQTALTVVAGQMSLTDLGTMLAQSGYFQDARDAAQAVVKVLAGQELGFPPIASMTGIYIVKGRVTLSANMIAAAVKRSGKYNYLIRQMDNNGCVIEFFEGSQGIGTSKFTREDAIAAGLATGENYKHYPRNMFFSRAMSNGAKWFTPDIFGGSLYTPEELGAVIDGETGEVLHIPSDSAETEPQRQQPTEGAKPEIPERPWQPDKLKELIDYQVSQSRHSQQPGSRTEEQGGLIAGKLREIWGEDKDAEQHAHDLLRFLVGDPSTKHLSKAQATVVLNWLAKPKDKSGDYPLKEMAVREAWLVLNQLQIAAGQMEMFNNAGTPPLDPEESA